jgi:hypothetical protein
VTTRHAGYLVTLAEDIREDDAEAVITALRMVRGVIAVEPIEGMTFDIAIAKQRADTEWRERIIGLLRDDRRNA